MQRKINAVLLVLFALVAPIIHAEIIVTPVTSIEEIKNSYVVGPGGHVIVSLPGKGSQKDAYGITIDVDNAIYKDITAYLVDADNLRSYTQHTQYRGIGFIRAKAPFTIQGSTQTPGPHYLILDNTYALFISKKLNVSIKAAFPMDETQTQLIKTKFTAMYENLKKVFVFPDFNIHVQPCGQVNAFSDSFTSGDIHICTELMDNVSRSKNIGAFTFILFHELGHSLLGLWGLPGNDNEDIADEFATYLMMQGRNTKLLESSLDFWRNKDSTSEAMNMIKYGDRHSLSVQRIRNIQENIKRGDAFIKRWNSELYPHMTSVTLNEVIQQPVGGSDVELARSILKQRNEVK